MSIKPIFYLPSFLTAIEEENRTAEQKAKQKAKQKDIEKIIGKSIKIRKTGEEEVGVYDNVKIFTTPDQTTIQGYLLSLSYNEVDFFADKRKGLIDKICDKELTEKDLYDIIIEHKEQVDPIAKDVLNIDMFIKKIFQDQK